MKDKATKLNDTSHLIEYYNNYDEEGRLLSRHGQIEYLTTMKYIEDALGGNKRKRILEAGAGTGRYSVTLAQMGYQVDALELVEHNLEVLRSKLTGGENITAVQGNVLDMSCYEDNTFDLTLVFGPMYHLYSKEDQEQALKEAVRVTKPGGHIMVAYCMNDCVVIQASFIQNQILHHIENHMLTEDFHCISEPKDLFAMMRIEEIHALTEKLPVTRQKTIATDGLKFFLCDTIDAMDDLTFDYYMKYHFATCERQDLIGYTNHSLDILKKKENDL